jgi:HK97 family phage portal protein
MFGRLFQKRAALPPWAVTVGPSSGPLPTLAGTTVGSDEALRLAAVWSCVRLLADTVSCLPVDTYRRGDRNAIEPAPLIVQEPAAGQPVHEWLYSVMVSLLLRGNAFGIITARSGATLLPQQVELIHPDRIGVTVQEDGHVQYRVLGKEIDAEDVWHAKAYTMPGSIMGLSPVEYSRQAIGLGLAAEGFASQFFGDGATPSGMLTAQGKLTPEQATELQTQWADSHGRRRKTAVLGGGIAYTPISVKPEESQFIETMQYNTASIARVFGVPPWMIGAESGDSLTYSNTESQSLQYLKHSVTPWLTRIESALGRLLPRNQFVKFNTGGLLKADTKSRYDAYKVGVEGGWLTIDEVRELEDLSPLPASGPGTAPAGNGAGTPGDMATVT